MDEIAKLKAQLEALEPYLSDDCPQNLWPDARFRKVAARQEFQQRFGTVLEARGLDNRAFNYR